VLLSIKSRPAMRIEISVMESMRPCHRSRGQTQPIYRQNPRFGGPSMQFVVAAAQFFDEFTQTR
jgi:hypothetical protein